MWAVSRALNNPKLSTDGQKHHLALIEAIAKELEMDCKLRTSYRKPIVHWTRQLFTWPAKNIHDFELCLYDTQAATIGGVYDEFIFSARIDNLGMSYCSLMASISLWVCLTEQAYELDMSFWPGICTIRPWLTVPTTLSKSLTSASFLCLITKKWAAQLHTARTLTSCLRPFSV